MRELAKATPMVVIFGIPGSGKTTIARKAVELLSVQTSETIQPVSLDLDVCVPEWMRNNFLKGVYPNSSERREFAMACCDRVDESLQRASTELSEKDVHAQLVGIISFSFVNEDLRDFFRDRFPDSNWILVHTSEDEAQRRIEQRQGHFYKGKAVRDIMPQTKKGKHTDTDNTDWNFAPVTFPHTILDGRNLIQENAQEIVEVVVRAVCI